MHIAIEEILPLIRSYASDPQIATTFICAYFGMFLFCCTFFIPVSAIFLLLAGAIFPFYKAIILCTLSASIGATCSMLIVRYLCKGPARSWVAPWVSKWENKPFFHDLEYLLFALRMNPLIPYPIINIFFGLTNITAIRFFFITILAMMPIIVLYVQAGSVIASVLMLENVVKWPMILTLASIGLVPWFWVKLKKHRKTN